MRMACDQIMLARVYVSDGATGHATEQRVLDIQLTQRMARGAAGPASAWVAQCHLARPVGARRGGAAGELCADGAVADSTARTEPDRLRRSTTHYGASMGSDDATGAGHALPARPVSGVGVDSLQASAA